MPQAERANGFSAYPLKVDKTMTLSEARSYIGKRCSIGWKNVREQEEITISVIQDMLYLPLFFFSFTADR